MLALFSNRKITCSCSYLKITKATKNNCRHGNRYQTVARKYTQSRVPQITSAIRWQRTTSARRTGTTHFRTQGEIQVRFYSRDISQLGQLEEVKQRKLFEQFLESRCKSATTSNPAKATESHSSYPMDRASAEIIMNSSLATFLLHVESRIASFLGQGFYTIGPCGEENMACLGLVASATDPMALHYRHLAASISRQLKIGKTMEDVLLDRARGYTCSVFDPVTGGRHCALGGTEYDFYVTSTLASQAPPAVGRALGIALANKLLDHREGGKGKPARFPADAVSIVSVGDGSVNNAMFLSATNMADYARHRNFKCPVLFVVSNNDICISLRGYGWLDTYMNRQIMPVTRANGLDLLDVWEKTHEAVNKVRRTKRPAFLVVDDLPRRFGHAATDRQLAYMDEGEISTNANTNPLVGSCEQLVAQGIFSWDDLHSKWKSLSGMVETAFDNASAEPKIISREQATVNLQASLGGTAPQFLELSENDRKFKPGTMRMRMNDVYFEAMSIRPECVYVGEDVRHGGYYLVTENLYETFPDRVHDFPPDETMLFGVGMGYAHNGLLPIVEMPYAKYLDCGADMFFESVITHWCTNGKQPNGMLIRLQGFDKGVFGGNYHTHNTLHLPPGLDVVCYSNGSDYVRGIRYALMQAEAGRVVMSVDSTDLLNRRDLFPQAKDGLWMRPFPDPIKTTPLTFDHVMLYPDADNPTSCEEFFHNKPQECADESVCSSSFDALVITYGNGVPTALQAMVKMKQTRRIGVIDCPNLNSLPEGLKGVLTHHKSVPIVFADVCKEGASPLTSLIGKLNTNKMLSPKWSICSASPTYNPLGCTATFLNTEDIISAVDGLCN